MKRVKVRKKFTRILLGGVIGLINGFFGSGGGIIAVQSMERLGVKQKQAHATSLLVILPLSVASAVIYFLGGSIPWDANTFWLLGGASAGGLAGALLLGKLKVVWVDILFTLLILASGVRMVF